MKPWRQSNFVDLIPSMRPLAAPADTVRSGCLDLATTSPLLTWPSGHRASSQADVARMASTSMMTVVEGLRRQWWRGLRGRCAHRLRPVCAGVLPSSPTATSTLRTLPLPSLEISPSVTASSSVAQLTRSLCACARPPCPRQVVRVRSPTPRS